MTETTCPTCGSDVAIATGDDSTAQFVPLTEQLARRIERLELEQLIERAAINRVLDAWERRDAFEQQWGHVSAELIEAIAGLRAGEGAT